MVLVLYCLHHCLAICVSRLGLIGYFFGVNNPALILMILFLALGFLLLTVFTGFAYDVNGQAGSSSGTSDLQVI